MKSSNNSRSWRKRLVCALLALCLLFTLVPAMAEPAPALTEAANETSGAVFLQGDRAGYPVTSMEDAAKVVTALSQELGTDGRSVFEPWRTLTDTAGNRYYVFQQMYAETTVSGGAVKIITEPAGTMLGAVSSVETELPDTALSQGITAQEAEAIVRKHEKERLEKEPELLPGQTVKVILPVNRDIDPYSQESKEESRFVWAVYTSHTEGSVKQGSDLPFLAHYVAMDGAYLYSLPTQMPGDIASVSGYDASYVFQFMESVPYTGTISMPDGTKQEISLDLMRDSRTGMYYLGNLERRIAVADCYPFLYEQGRVKLEASPDNTGWDETCLVSLYNYCRAWDYYAAIGWRGGDGLETPILILKDYCDANHQPVDNAAYAGKYYGWQLFLSSSANQFSKALDVLAHEFTHCVTTSVMTYNAYMNDYGAINEAMSDIHGNICEMLAGATTDTTWILGESSGQPVRSMSDPHRHQQPEYAWDLYYQPRVQTPTDINDRGGVHTNSSLLNRIAYLLCTQGGMTLEEARAFWFAVDCTMVPGTDYVQLAKLLPWVMGNLGLNTYLPALEQAIEATGIRDSRLPEKVPEDRALVSLTLPDKEIFTDGNWNMYVLTLDVPAFQARIQDVIHGTNGCENALTELMDAIGEVMKASKPEPEKKEEEKGFLDGLLDLLNGEKKEEPAPEPKEEAPVNSAALGDWLRKYFSGTYFAGGAAAGQDGRTIRMMARPGTALPMLLQLKIKPGTVEPETLDLAVYVAGRWVELGFVLQQAAELDKMTEEEQNKYFEQLDLSAYKDLLIGEDGKPDLQRFFDKVFLKIAGGETVELPSTGLENAQILSGEALQSIMPEEAAPTEEKPAEEKPAEEKPAEENSAEEKPDEEKPAEEKPTEDRVEEEKPAA